MLNETGEKVWELVQEWNPSEEYDHERKYQSELQEYLEKRLNEENDPLDSTDYAVSTEHGTAKGDVVVNDEVGIELKRNFSNSQKRKLRGQLEDYGDNYDFVIACACGVEDRDGWYEVKNKIENSREVGDMTGYEFIIKERDSFGEEQAKNNSASSESDELPISDDDMDITAVGGILSIVGVGLLYSGTYSPIVSVGTLVIGLAILGLSLFTGVFEEFGG